MKHFKSLLLCMTLAASVLTAADNYTSYNWLEDIESLTTQAWIEQQHSRFHGYIDPKKSMSEEIRDSLKKMTSDDSYSIPRKVGNRYFCIAKNGTEKRRKLYVQEGFEGTPRVVVDPGLLNANVSLENFVVSPNGEFLAYALSENGSDYLTCRIKNISADTDLSDTVEKIKFSPVVWSPDSRGFFYSRFDDNTLHSIHYHALGTNQEKDRLVYRDLSDGSVGYTPFISRDNRYLIIDAFHGSAGPNTISILDLESADAKPIAIIPRDGGTYWFVASAGTKFYFFTNKNANNKKVACVDISDKEYKIKDFIPESQLLLEYVVPFGEGFCALTSESAVNQLVLFDQEGKLVRQISLPATGKITLNRINQNAPQTGDELFFALTNFFQPTTIYHYKLNSTVQQIFKESVLQIDPSQFELKQIFYSSKDGTKVPMFLAYKKGIKLDGNTPTLLTGYGAYGFIGYPTYNAANLLWLERGGVLALANIRGGGEYGESWHQGAVREKKQNSFDDFIAAAEWLIENHYTNATHLAAIGMSSGGLLVAASANQRPDLFKAIVVEAGLLDLLRFHLFTVGRFWIQEHGNPDDPKDFAYLAKFSPCHNVRKTEKFPAVLVTASEHDDRVVPSQSYKYVAALQEVYPDHTMLLRLNNHVGHDTSRSSTWIDERADILTFIYSELE